MRILGTDWQEGYLDYYRKPGEVRIAVCAWMVIGKVPGMFFERPKSPRMVWNYVREVGLASTLQKIRSRYAERLRNKRYFSIGAGRVLECDPSAPLSPRTPVLFVAAAHPRCVERIVLPAVVIRPIDESLLKRFESPGGVHWRDAGGHDLLNEDLCGWLPESGWTLPQNAIRTVLDRAEDLWRKATPASMRWLPIPENTMPRTVFPRGTHHSNGTVQACIFGLGNYAKTQIIPNLPKRIRLACVHESDPTQLGQLERFGWSVDTNPCLHESEQYDVCFIAGYHHTHADLAIAAIERGGYAVVEKPVVTTHDQLDRLTEVLKQHPGRLFACFHMRYNPLTERVWEDLGVERGDAIHYYCTVFEVPLPPRHWYRWPNSRSHVISNGCHWLDHFLHLNSYSPPVDYDIRPCSNGDSQIYLELKNGAVMGMHLTHAGSDRLGVRDHVEMRANGRTAVLESGSRYLIENSTKILRRARSNRVNAYRSMYRDICDKILRREEGDSIESVIIPHVLALTLEDRRETAVARKPLTISKSGDTG